MLEGFHVVLPSGLVESTTPSKAVSQSTKKGCFLAGGEPSAVTSWVLHVRVPFG